MGCNIILSDKKIIPFDQLFVFILNYLYLYLYLYSMRLACYTRC